MEGDKVPFAVRRVRLLGGVAETLPVSEMFAVRRVRLLGGVAETLPVSEMFAVSRVRLLGGCGGNTASI